MIDKLFKLGTVVKWSLALVGLEYAREKGGDGGPVAEVVDKVVLPKAKVMAGEVVRGISQVGEGAVNIALPAAQPVIDAAQGVAQNAPATLKGAGETIGGSMKTANEGASNFFDGMVGENWGGTAKAVTAGVAGLGLASLLGGGGGSRNLLGKLVDKAIEIPANFAKEILGAGKSLGVTAIVLGGSIALIWAVMTGRMGEAFNAISEKLGFGGKEKSDDKPHPQENPLPQPEQKAAPVQEKMPQDYDVRVAAQGLASHSSGVENANRSDPVSPTAVALNQEQQPTRRDVTSSVGLVG